MPCTIRLAYVCSYTHPNGCAGKADERHFLAEQLTIILRELVAVQVGKDLREQSCALTSVLHHCASQVYPAQRPWQVILAADKTTFKASGMYTNNYSIIIPVISPQCLHNWKKVCNSLLDICKTSHPHVDYLVHSMHIHAGFTSIHFSTYTILPLAKILGTYWEVTPLQNSWQRAVRRSELLIAC